MKNLNFIKAQGLGNDFVIFFNQIDFGVSKKLINFISDRKIGVGCDLVAIVNESKSNYCRTLGYSFPNCFLIQKHKNVKDRFSITQTH